MLCSPILSMLYLFFIVCFAGIVLKCLFSVELSVYIALAH